MRSIFELATPRDEVLQGELSKEMFVARLKDVIGDSAEPVYKYPDKFYANTYPTAGLCSLLWEVLGHAQAIFAARGNRRAAGCGVIPGNPTEMYCAICD